MNKIKEIIRELKWECQRADNGYADCDLWNFDEYLAKIIKEGCFILAEEHNGYPDGMTDDEWTQILLDISFGYGSYLEMRSGVYESKEPEFKRLKKEYENGKKLFAKYFNFLWD